LQRLGWTPKPNEAPTDAVLRGCVIVSLGNLGDPAVIAEARARYAKFLAKPRSLPADLRLPVLTLVGRYSDRPTYVELHQLARSATGTEERQLYYRAMAGALDPELAMLTLSIALTDETVPQETTSLVPQVAQSGEQPELAWEFARRHLKELLGELESFRRNTYLPAIMGPFSDAARADELETYVKENLGEDALAKAREAAEGIRFKAGWKERELPGIDRWIATQTAAASKSK
jgi:aminopeptidase N